MGVVAEALQGGNNRTYCEVGIYLSRLDSEDLDALLSALATPKTLLGHEAIHQSLRDKAVVEKYGKPPEALTIGRHRNGKCRRCPAPEPRAAA